MLHQLSCLCFLVATVSVAMARESTDPASIDIVRDAELKGLQSLIGPRVVQISRRQTKKGGVTYPGGYETHGNGWRLGQSLVLTASALVEGWSAADSDRLTVTIGGEPRPARVTRIDIRKGIAVLAVEAMPAASERYPTWSPPADREFWPGRPVFAAGPGTHARRFAFTGPSPEPFSYYLSSTGDLPLGTPLTDAQGRLLTLVGLLHFEQPGVIFLLPADALRWVKQATEGGP